MFTQKITYLYDPKFSDYGFEPFKNEKGEYIAERSIELEFSECSPMCGGYYMMVIVRERFSNKDGYLQSRQLENRSFYSKDFLELEYDFSSMPFLRDKVATNMAYRIFKTICRENVIKEFFPKMYSWWEKIDKEFGSC
jgi:hypothetical protein